VIRVTSGTGVSLVRSLAISLSRSRSLALSLSVSFPNPRMTHGCYVRGMCAHRRLRPACVRSILSLNAYTHMSTLAPQINQLGKYTDENPVIFSMMYIFIVNYLHAHSIPTWMRPYACLSNGEQARSRLARQIKDNAVIDDFTSVVNRHVAWAMSNTLHLYTTTTASTHRTTDTDTCCTRTGLTPTVVNRHAAWAMSSSISRFIRRRNFQRCYANLNPKL